MNAAEFRVVRVQRLLAHHLPVLMSEMKYSRSLYSAEEKDANNNMIMKRVTLISACTFTPNTKTRTQMAWAHHQHRTDSGPRSYVTRAHHAGELHPKSCDAENNSSTSNTEPQQKISTIRMCKSREEQKKKMKKKNASSLRQKRKRFSSAVKSSRVMKVK